MGALALAAASLTACARGADEPKVIRVPADAPTLTAAAERVSPGDVILVAPGRYTESVTIATPDVTLRGEDRGTVVIDGEGLRANGVQVIADGVRVQNLTVVDHTFNGVLVTGMHDANGPHAHNLSGYETLDPEAFPPLERFEISHVTAAGNGLYGLYAFNARHGAIRDSYASGSADSGIYVGQCEQCDVVVEGNVAERNAIGYENANASDSVLVVGNRFSRNRVGMTLLTWYQEAFVPQRGITVAGNLISENAEATSPAHAEGAFGTGVGLAGAQDNVLERNRITANPRAGVLVANTEDVASVGTVLRGNVMDGNGIDVADVSAPRSPSSGTCFEDAPAVRTLPAELAEARCPGGSLPGASVDPALLPSLEVPEGMSFRDVPRPGPLPGWPGVLDELPAPLPTSPARPAVADVPVPPADFLADLAASR